MKRLAIAFFYDKEGIVDEYMTHLVQSFRPFVEKTIFVANGFLTEGSGNAVHAVADTVLIRENVGFDVWAYKHALEHVGFENLAEYDEVLLYNHTFYGPIYPFSEMFNEMSKRDCDFWGITAHKALTPNPFTGQGTLPMHINSHFIAVRKKMLLSSEFQTYWRNIPTIKNYTDSVLLHESRFTEHFSDLGFSHSTYLNTEDYTTHYPALLEVHETMARRCPIVKRRNFFNEQDYFEENGTNFPLALKIIRGTSDYPEAFMWKNALRSSRLRVMNTNASMMHILPEHSSRKKIDPNRYGKIAVCAHVFYVEMLMEILAKTSNIPVPYDFIATTDTKEKARKIKAILSRHLGIVKSEVRIVEQNRGRDMAALFITCRDIFIDSNYDLVCRLHTKKSPQVDRNIGEIFKNHLFENLLHNKGYVTNLLELFLERPWIGIVMPPIVNISFPAIGFSWFTNKSWATHLVDYLGLKVELDADTPVAPYGTMFWFRPKALRKLFEPTWTWLLFNAEPNHSDGGFAHVLERMICYVAQDAGFTTEHVANAEYAAQSYTNMEYKLDKLMSRIPPNFVRVQAAYLEHWKGVAAKPLSGFEPASSPVNRNWLHRFRVSLYPASNMIKDPIKDFFRRRLRFKSLS